MPRRRKKKFTMPTDIVSGRKGKKYAGIFPDKPGTPTERGTLAIKERGIEHVFDQDVHSTLPAKRVFQDSSGDSYEMQKVRRGGKTKGYKKISKRRGERFLTNVAKKAVKYQETFGEGYSGATDSWVEPTARGKKKRERIMERDAKKRSRHVKRINRRNK